MKHLILIIGKAHVGKDTCYDYIKKYLSSKNIYVEKYVLADKLKIITKEMIKLLKGIDIPMRYFYDNNEKEKERPEFGTILTENGEEIFTIRRCLQTIGTDILRKKFDNEIWISQGKKFIETSNNVIVIPDCRIANEVSFFKEIKTHKVTSIKIIRNTDKITKYGKSHTTEKDVDKIKYDYIIYNNKDLQTFYHNIEKIINNILNC